MGQGAQAPIVIAGGGIAGVTCALALAKKGFSSRIFERSETPNVSGAGIQLSANAVRILDRLGLGEVLRDVGSVPSGILIKDAYSGKQLTQFDLGSTHNRLYGAPYLTLHRGELLNALLQSASCNDRISIEGGAIVPSALDLGDVVQVAIEKNGKVETVEGTALIGADGVGSQVRSLVPGGSIPKDVGKIAWRGLIPKSALPDELEIATTQLWLARDAHVVTYYLGDAEYLNVVCILPKSKQHNSIDGWQELEQSALPFDLPNTWAPELRSLFQMDAKWGGWSVSSTSNVGALSKGRVCLIGDAAHAMVPFAAQGGAMAIEDAAILAVCCEKNKDAYPTAFKAYARDRKARINRVIKLAESNGRIYHAATPISWARNLSMQLAPQAMLQRRMRWLYGWEEPK